MKNDTWRTWITIIVSIVLDSIITCCNNRDYFVSELEFVPSLYCDRVDHLFIDRKLGDQIIEIINQTEEIKKEKNLKKINFKTIFK